jgi:hypothetical protein
MQSLGAAHLLVIVVLVVLALDSRRLHALARSGGRSRRETDSGRGLPPGADPDRVGLPLVQIQMRHHVDWQDGGSGWEGPEILPADDPDPVPSQLEPNPALPVLWSPPAGLSALVEFFARPGRAGELGVEGLAVANAAAHELGPVGDRGHRVGGLREERPEVGMVPTQIVAGAVSMLPDPSPEA